MTHFHGLLLGIISVACGILVLKFPKILNYLVGIYLIIVGAISIIGAL